MLYLKNTTWIDPNTFVQTRGTLAVEPGTHGGISLQADIPPLAEFDSDDRVLDCGGRFVTRSFVNAHHHTYSTLSRGMPPSSTVPVSFLDTLRHVWWRLDKRLDLEMIEASALVAALHSAKAGVTFIIDHHASPFHLEGCLATIARAFDLVGVGHLLCYELSGRDGKAVEEAGLAETDAYLSSGRKGHVGLHASFTVDDALLHHAVNMAQRHHTGIHMHVAEAESDQKHCVETYGKRVINRLADAGVLELPHTLLAHCIHLDAEERALLADAKCWVVQNTESNQNNNVGLGQYYLYPRVMFGTDGMHTDVLRSMQSAYFIAAHAGDKLSPQGANHRLRTAHQLTQAINAPGDGDNNLIVFDYDTPTPVTSSNTAGHLCYGMSASNVHTVISQGRAIVENHRLVTVDEATILAYAQEQAKRLWTLLA